MRTEAISIIKDFFDNYYSPFIGYKYHGYSGHSDCIEKCENYPLPGGLLPVSRLEQLESVVRNDSQMAIFPIWRSLCYGTNPNARSLNNASCSFFVDAEFNWQDRMWQSKGLEIGDHMWHREVDNYPGMPVMSE